MDRAQPPSRQFTDAIIEQNSKVLTVLAEHPLHSQLYLTGAEQWGGIALAVRFQLLQRIQQVGCHQVEIQLQVHCPFGMKTPASWVWATSSKRSAKASILSMERVIPAAILWPPQRINRSPH